MSDKVDCDVSVERVTGAELWVVSSEYIDYYQSGRFGKRHRFAFIKRKSFSKEGYEQLMNTLRQHLFENQRIDLIIEKRKANKIQGFEDYLIKIG